MSWDASDEDTWERWQRQPKTPTLNRNGRCCACDQPHGSNARCGICSPRGEAAEGAAPAASNPVGSGDDAALNAAFVAWVNNELLRRMA